MIYQVDNSNTRHGAFHMMQIEKRSAKNGNDFLPIWTSDELKRNGYHSETKQSSALGNFGFFNERPKNIKRQKEASSNGNSHLKLSIVKLF